MSILDIVELGTSLIKDGVALWQGITSITDEDGDDEPMGESDVFQSLGVSSMPYPSDDDGFCEGICVREIAGRDTCFIGARDTRSAAIVGNLKPGDTVLHSTGPQQAAQVQCKEDKRQVLMATKDNNGKTMMVMLDGTTGKFQVVLPGMIFEMDSSNGNYLMTNSECSVLIQGSTIALDGLVIAGGRTPDPVNKIMTSKHVAAAPTAIAIGAPNAGVTYTKFAAAAKGLFLAK